jgi:hypothetical protein
MAITFDGTAKTMTLSAGTTQLNVLDLYSRWKDWIAAGNAWAPQAFAPVGGDPIDVAAGTSIPLYAFLINAWRVRPQEANHTLAVTGGVLLVDGGGDPFLDTAGDFVVRINYQQPVQAIVVGGIGGSGGLTTDQAARLERIEKWLRNKRITNPATGKQIVYDDDNSTVLGEGDLFEDAAGTQPYRGQGAELAERLA